MERSSGKSELPFEVENEVNTILSSFSYDMSKDECEEQQSEFDEYDETEEQDEVDDDPLLDLDLEEEFESMFNTTPSQTHPITAAATPQSSFAKRKQDDVNLFEGHEDLLGDDEFIYNIKRRRKAS